MLAVADLLARLDEIEEHVIDDENGRALDLIADLRKEVAL